MISKAISIRQPWPWLITMGYKPVENRTWETLWRGRTVTVTGVKGASIKARESNKPPAHAERGTFFAEDLEALA